MLVSDLIDNALTNINAKSAGEASASEDQDLALVYCNLIIESLNAAVKKSLFANYDPSLFTFVPVVVFANLAATVSLPAGWARALQYMTAVDIAPAFGRPIGDDLLKLATSARAAILTPPPTVVP